MITLRHVSDELQQLEQVISRQDVSPSDIRMSESGEIRICSEDLALNPEARKGIASLAGCPVTFFESVPDDLRASIANRLLPSSRLERISVAILNGSEVIGFSDAKLISLIGTEVLEAAFDAMPNSIRTGLEQLEVRRFRSAADILELDVTTPRASTELRVGDIAAAGISISHSPSGAFATQISTYLHRLACANGLLIPVCRNDKRLRVRRLDRSRFSRDEMLENIRRISQIAWDELDLKLRAVAELSKNKVDPEAMLADLAKRMHLNRKISKALRDALYADELGFDTSQLGIINAISRVATHDSGLNQMLRRRLMEASGVLSQAEVHRCPVCLSVVRGRIAA